MLKNIEKILIQGNLRYQSKIIQETEKLKVEESFPRYPILILTCMDPRIDVYRIFQLNPGDVFVLRNAGNQYTQDVFRSILIAIYEYDVKYIIILGHLDCGMTKVKLNILKNKLHILNGKHVSQYGLNLIKEMREFFKPFIDELRNVKKQIETFQKLREIPEDVKITGMLYDVNTGWIFEHNRFKTFIFIENFMKVYKEVLQKKQFELVDFLESSDEEIVGSGSLEQEIEESRSNDSKSKSIEKENRNEKKNEIESYEMIDLDLIDVCDLREIYYQKTINSINMPKVRIPKICHRKVKIYFPNIQKKKISQVK